MHTRQNMFTYFSRSKKRPLRENADKAKKMFYSFVWFVSRRETLPCIKIFTSQNQIFHREKHLFLVHISRPYFSYIFFLLEHNGIFSEHNRVFSEHNRVFSEHNRVFPEHNEVFSEQNRWWDGQKYEEKVGLCMNWVPVRPNRL